METVLRQISDAGEDVGEPGLRIDVVQLGRGDQAVQDRGALAAAIGASEQPRLPPQGDAAQGALPSVTLEIWDVWADPLGHVNHPVYVDFCDEALSRSLRARGIEPARLVPVAEQVHFKGGVAPGDRVTVETEASGWDASGAAVFRQRILVGERLAATATAVRKLFGEEGKSTLIA